MLCRNKDAFGESFNSLAYGSAAANQKGMIGRVDGTKTCYMAELKENGDCFSELNVHHNSDKGVMKIDYVTKYGKSAELGEPVLQVGGLHKTRLNFGGGCLSGFYGKQANLEILDLSFLYSYWKTGAEQHFEVAPPLGSD